MSWVNDVACSHCRDFAAQWSVINGVWTHACGQQMSMSAIKAMQAVEDRK